MIKWENVCLVCLHEGENRFIFEEDDDSKVIADKIMKCADILIKRDTNQPRNICLQCLDDLNVAYKFRRNCEHSNSIIKTLLTTNNQEFKMKDLLIATITVDPTPDICIKDEIVVNALANDTYDNENKSYLDLKADSETGAKFVIEEGEDTCIHSDSMELSNLKTSESNKTKQEMNYKIGRRPRGRPKKSTETACTNARHKSAPKHETSICTKDEIAENAGGGDTRATTCLDLLEDDPEIEAKFVVEVCTDAYVHNNATELNNIKACESNKTKHEINCEISRRLGEGIELTNVKNNPGNETKQEMKCEISKQAKRRSKKSTKTAELKSTSMNKPQIICKICGHAFRFQSTFDIHMRRHNNERPFSCDHCDKAFVRAQELRRHVRVHTGQKPYKCQYCDRGFSDMSVKQNHESTHTGERPYKCPTCDKTFATYSKGLMMHLRIHTGERKFTCKKCGKGFMKKGLFEKHLARHLAREELDKSTEHKPKKRRPKKEIFQIEENPNSNEINIKHEIIDNANCDIIQKSNREISKRCRGRPKKSTGVSLKVCEICNQSFKDQCNLDIHMRRHNNERPFTCDHCDKAFVRVQELRSHMRVHTGQKLYKCRYCDSRFSEYSARNNHERTHASERPYKCSTCGKSFASYSKGLMRHLRIHTGEKKFICKKCGKVFMNRWLFEKHVARHQARDALYKSLEHQKKSLKKEILQIEECVDSIEISIKHESEISPIEENPNLNETNIKPEIEPIEEEVR